MTDISLISIIVPVYNMQETVRRCLDSILNQSYKNIEVVVIDDGSSDGSREIIQEIAYSDERIKYISRPNKGLSLTLKEGINVASGNWLMFVDSDDYIDTNLVSTLIENQIKHDADVVQANIKFIDVNGNLISILHSQNRIVDDKDELLRAYFLDGTMNVTFATNLIRKELIKDVPFYKDSISMDLQVMPFVYARCRRFVQIAEPFYNAIQYANSVSRGSVSEKMFNDKFRCNEILQSFFEKHAPNLMDFMYYRRAGIAVNLYMKIKYGDGEVSDRDTKLRKCKIEFKNNYRKYMSSELLKTIPKKNRYKMLLFNFSPGVLNVVTKMYSKRIGL